MCVVNGGYTTHAGTGHTYGIHGAHTVITQGGQCLFLFSHTRYTQCALLIESEAMLRVDYAEP